ncbi:MAG: hypothetical protein ACKPJD_38995 [Planctomycetaceae bacterium]
MGGGPPTIDIWDLKPGSKNGGEFQPIDTAAPGVQISEHMPETAKMIHPSTRPIARPISTTVSSSRLSSSGSSIPKVYFDGAALGAGLAAAPGRNDFRRSLASAAAGELG